MEILNSLLRVIQHFGVLGYWLVLLISFFESLAFIGAIIPGVIIVAFAGFLSAQGFLGIGDLIWFAAIGAILGGGLNFWLGSKGKRFFRNEEKLLKLEQLEKGEEFYKKYGNKSVFLGKFFGPIRPVIPFVAGLSKMNKWQFLLWNVAGAFLWAAFYLLLGYFLGSIVRAIEMWAPRPGVFFFVLFICVAALWLVFKKSGGFFHFLKSVIFSMKEAVIKNPDVQRFVKKHPTLFNFLGQRLERHKFFGLPFTLLFTAFLYVVFLFFGVVQNIFSSNPIVTADINVANLFFAFRSAELISIFTWITLIANWQIITSLAVLVTALCWLWKKRMYILPLWITMAGSEFFNLLGKAFFHRPRPATAYFLENSFSFPSGHATMAAAFFGFIIYILFREVKKWKYRTTLLFIGTVTILAVGLSRLYLGEHFLSDVWSGYQLGLSWLIIGISLTEWRIRRKTDILHAPISGKVKFISVSLILLQAVFYVNFASKYSLPLTTPKETGEKILVSDILDPFQNGKISRFVETLVGSDQEPLSFVIVAKDDEKLLEGIKKAGWYVADPANLTSMAQLAKTAALNQGYPTAPMSPSFWNTKVNDFGFQKPTDANTSRARHHARFWRTQFKTQNGDNIYVGMTSLDIGVKWGFTHKINPDVDTDREFFFADLERSGLISRFEKIQFVDSLLGKNFFGDQFFTDGKLYEIYFK